MKVEDAKTWLLFAVIALALAAFAAWANLSGWVDGQTDTFPGVDFPGGHSESSPAG